jgi:multisubunit Na+/H+ antiporter MnhB subunit
MATTSKEFFDSLLHLGHASHTTDQDDFVNVGLADIGILDTVLL